MRIIFTRTIVYEKSFRGNVILFAVVWFSAKSIGIIQC